MKNILVNYGPIALTVIGAMFFVVYQALNRRFSSLIDKDLSRFDLFAARDELIRLAAQNRIPQTNRAWLQVK
jgi:hypothetical protein